MNIAVIGAGSWGTALSFVLARNHHTVHLWAKDEVSLQDMKASRENHIYLPGYPFPDEIKIEPSFEAAIRNSDEVLIAVPSHAFKEVVKRLQPLLKPGQGLFWATKGLDASARFLHEIVEEELGACPMALLTGPSFAEEVAEGLPTAVTVASNQANYGHKVQALFQSPHFRVYLSDDLLGAEIGGAVKNVLALAVGIAEGLGFRTNTKAALMTRGLAEMMRLGESLGAKRETLMGLSGLGDLILTCSDTQSRNLRFGIMLGQNVSIDEACQKIGQVVESIPTAELVFKLASRLKVRMPIVSQIYAILYEKLSPKAAILKLLQATPAKE